MTLTTENQIATKVAIITDQHFGARNDNQHFHQFFEKFYKEYGISYASVLELNHKKMLDISDNCIDCDPDILCFIFESIIKDYKMMLNRENPYLED